MDMSFLFVLAATACACMVRADERRVSLSGDPTKPVLPHVIGRIANAACFEGLHPGLAKAFEFLRRPDLKDLKPGRYPIDGTNCYANVFETKLRPLADDLAFEVHHAFIDIQVPLTGSETIGLVETPPDSGPFDTVNDCALFHGKGRLAEVGPGEFAMFFPYAGAHAPGYSSTGARSIRKVVVKLRLDNDGEKNERGNGR